MFIGSRSQQMVNPFVYTTKLSLQRQRLRKTVGSFAQILGGKKIHMNVELHLPVAAHLDVSVLLLQLVHS